MEDLSVVKERLVIARLTVLCWELGYSMSAIMFKNERTNAILPTHNVSIKPAIFCLVYK